MHSLTIFLKENCRLSSPLPMLAVFGIGVALLFWRRSSRIGRSWLTIALLGFWFVSTPTGARLLSAPLVSAAQRLESPDQAAGAQAVVVLGGGIVSHVADGFALDDLGESAARVMEGARVYRLLGDPLVIVSGGNTERLDPPRAEAAAFRDAIVRLGVPVSRVVVEDQGLTTREQAIILRSMLAARHIDRIVLVTAPTHMTRSLATFRALGVNAVPSASRARTDPGAQWSLWPERQSLVASDLAVYDYVSWLYYRLHGWN
jgi:uncharacterized SAM-binding protein YcdF (DUF218 family)